MSRDDVPLVSEGVRMDSGVTVSYTHLDVYKRQPSIMVKTTASVVAYCVYRA